MTALGPAALPTIYTLTIPSSTLATVNHDQMHVNIQDEERAIWNKLGLSESSAQDTPLANTVLTSLTNGKAKWATVITAMLAANAVTQRTMTASFSGTRTANSYADVDTTNGKATLTTTGGDLLALFVGSVSNNLGGVVQHVGLRLDAGSDVGAIGVSSVPGAGNYPTPFIVPWLFTGVSAAAHSVFARHTNDSASGTMSTAGFIILLEIKR